MNHDIETDAIVAATDLALRCGSSSFEIGYLNEDPADPKWWVKVHWKTDRKIGGKVRVPAATTIIVENCASPDEAADAMARRLLSGGAECTYCHLTVTMNDREPGCRWSRTGAKWERGCLEAVPA